VTWFEQYVPAFSAELLTVLSCDNFSNPDVSRKRWHSAAFAVFLTFRDNSANPDIRRKILSPSGFKKIWIWV